MANVINAISTVEQTRPSVCGHQWRNQSLGVAAARTRLSSMYYRNRPDEFIKCVDFMSLVYTHDPQLCSRATKTPRCPHFLHPSRSPGSVGTNQGHVKAVRRIGSYDAHRERLLSKVGDEE